MSAKASLLRVVNLLTRRVAGVQIVPEWQLNWGYRERAHLEVARRADLQTVQPRRAERINLGCADDIRSGWLNVDSRPLRPDSELFLCAELLLIDYYLEDGCALEILAQDVLEHVSWRDVDDLLAVLSKKLAPGGRLVVQSPNLDALCDAYRSGQLSFQAVERLLYGDQTYPANTHRCAFSPAAIHERFERLGLTVESVEPIQYNVRAVGRRPSL